VVPLLDVASYLPTVAYVVFLACCLIWGSTFLAIRIGNEAVPPVWAATLRLALAAPLLTGLVLATRQRFPRGPALRGALLFGIFNFGINLSLLYWGERVVPSGIAAVLYATVPLSTALIAAALGVERLAPRKIGAAALAIVGVAVIFLGELRLDVPLIGLIAVFFAATAAALSSVFLKRAPQPSAIAANAVGAAIGAIVCLLISLALGEDHALPTTSAGWWPIAYLTIAGSLGAYVLYTWLVQHWPVTNASMVGVVVPVIAVILGALAKGEQRTPESYLGAAVVLIAVIVALRPSFGFTRATGAAVAK
jgi:drug/metabolite transporter (DMT)-like permease